MTGPQIIVLATPVFLAAIAIELAVGIARRRNTYRVHDALSSIGLGMLSQLVGLFTKLLAIGVYTAAYEHVALLRLPVDSIAVWVGALLMYDLCYYWLHRAGHRVGVFWAAHVVHHQSEDYNLSTALRQTSSGALLGWIFYLPMAIIGVPPLVFGTVALIDLLYQFWVHTQQVGKLGWFDRWFCSPSNHRVHHAVNDRYLDRNYGGILIIWDRLFGTFHEEDDDETVHLRHTCPAAQLQSTVGERRGVHRAGARRAARAFMVGQAAHLVHAAWLAARRRGRAVPEAGVSDQRGAALRPADRTQAHKCWLPPCSS